MHAPGPGAAAHGSPEYSAGLRVCRDACSCRTIEPCTELDDDQSPLSSLLVVVRLCAVSDELHQAFVPSRNCSVLDSLSDLVGASLALATWMPQWFPDAAWM